MGEFDEHAGINGDWMPPSPSPRSFFSSILGYDTGSASVSELPLKDDDNNNTTGFTFPEPDKQFGSENGQPTKASSRSGLVERMAARAGYNAPRLNTTDIIRPSVAESSYLTIPPGLSPTSLLDSPVFLSNSLVQPSPTTGKFPFAPNGNGNSRSSSMMFSKDNLFEDMSTSSFAFKPVPESSGAPVKVNPPFISWQSFSSIEASGQSENPFPPQSIETDKVNHFQNGNSDLSDVNKTELNNFTSQTRPFGANNGNVEENHNEDADRLMNVDNANSGPSEDGYNWRKYGQKQVKGSEYPRSYYKCTHPNCPVKKKVERSQEGHITEIIYKGAHNHPKPPLNRRIGSSSGGDWGHDGNFEVASSTMGGHGPSGSQFESSDAVTFSNEEEEEEEEDDRATHGSVSLGNNDDDESESKRRKVEDYAADISASSRAMREPRVVVQTTSEVDILDDGYRWRKYGQKVVKGNPNPRSYYKCTSTGCTVRKHVERASQDLKSVITTYEGKHNHDVPAARNNNNNNHQSQIQIQNRMHEYGYGMEEKMSILQHQSQYMLPKGEPVSDHPSLYHHQIMNSFSHI